METQEIFLELQEQLSSHDESSTPSSGESASTEKKIEEVVAQLAKKAGFQMEAVIGIGGQGAVIRAKDMKLNREVALKFLPPETVKDSKKVEELKGEAMVVSGIKHENVVSVLSWHEEDGVPFYAMELVEGESLMDRIRRTGKLSVTDSMRIVIEATRGVEELHSRDIVHRDIKPQNILLTKDGRVKITDFGISKDSDSISREARSGKIAGTPQFMAPEQARGEAATKHSDLYSLAATLYYCLAGKPPVKVVSNIKEQLRIVGEGKPIPIGNFVPKINRDVGKVIMKGLNGMPTKRGWSLQSYRQELEAAYIGQMKDSQSGLGTWFRHHKWYVIPAVSIMAGVTAGYFIGKHNALTPEPSPPPEPVVVEPEFVKQDVMDAIADGVSVDLQLLRVIAQNGPEANEAQRLVQEYDRAASNEEVERLSTLSGQISQEASEWISRSMGYLISTDTNSQLREQAIAVTGDSMLEDPDVYTEWLENWIIYLRENNQEVEALMREANIR